MGWDGIRGPWRELGDGMEVAEGGGGGGEERWDCNGMGMRLWVAVVVVLTSNRGFLNLGHIRRTVLYVQLPGGVRSTRCAFL
jgi:hypothetical protein